MRSPAKLAFSAIAIALLFAACGPPPPVVAGDSPAPTRGNRNLITTAELDASTHRNVLELIHAIRPMWFSHRGQESMALGQGVDVYVDGLRQDVRTLSQMSTSQVSQVEFLSPSDATFRFGTQIGSGAIVVTTRRP